MRRVPPAEHAKARTEIVNYLIDNMLVDQYLAQQKIAVDAKEVAARFSELQAELKKQGQEYQAMLKDMTREILDKAPYIWLPTPYIFTAWWPWVKNYGGELRAGAVRPGPIYARIWIDQDMKKKLGH